MAVSIRILLVVLLLVVAIAAAVTAFLPVYLTSVESLRSLGLDLRDQISQRLTLQIQIYFDEPMAFISGSRALSKMGIVDAFAPASNLGPMCDLVRRTGYTAYTGNDHGAFSMCNPTEGTAFALGPLWYAQWIVDNVTDTWKATMLFNASAVNQYDPRARPWYLPLRSAQAWSEVYVNYGGGSSVITAGCPLMSAAVPSSRAVGVQAIDISTDTMLDFLSTVSVMKTGRVFLAETRTASVLGGNWNESAIITINATRGEYRLAKLSDYKEPLVARTLSALGEDFIYNSTLPAKGEFGKGLDAVIWTISNITDEFGLDMRVVTMIPARDFLEDVQRNVNIGIGAAAAAVVVLMVLSFLLVMFLLAPLKRVEHQIECAADFQTRGEDGEDDSPSIISEVANIQAAYKKLQSELEMIKSYLPQSLLANLYDDEALDDNYGQSGAANSKPGGNDDGESSIKRSNAASSGHPSNSNHNSQSGSGGIVVRPRPNVSSQEGGGDSSSTWSQVSATTRQRRLDGRYGAAATGNSDRKSRTSNGAGGASGGSPSGGRAGGGLNTRGGVVMRMITVMSVNLRRFHQMVREGGIDKAGEAQSAMLAIVKAACDKNHGVIDSFMGDRVIVSFGAVAQQSAAAPKACFAAREIITKLRQSPAIAPYYGCTIGIATGEAHVGNMGSPQLRKFNIISPVLAQANQLERLCKLQRVELLVSTLTARFATFELHMEPLDIFRLPGEVQPSIVYTVFGPKLSHVEEGRQIEEWMYELQKQNEAKEQDEVITERFRKATAAMQLFIRNERESLATFFELQKKQSVFERDDEFTVGKQPPNSNGSEQPTSPTGDKPAAKMSSLGGDEDEPQASEDDSAAKSTAIPQQPTTSGAGGGASTDDEDEEDNEQQQQHQNVVPRGLIMVKKNFRKGIMTTQYLQAKELDFFEKCLVWDH